MLVLVEAMVLEKKIKILGFQDGDSGADAGPMGGHAASGSDMEHELETSHNPSLINFKK